VAGFVVCPSCGTQIKAGRAYCLRCGEALPLEGEQANLSVWESLQLSQAKRIILLPVLSLAVVGLGLFIWRTQPTPEQDVAKPLDMPIAPRTAPSAPPPSDVEPPAPVPSPPPSPAPPAIAESPAPVISLESHREGSAAYNAGDFEGARKAYEQAIARNPEDADALNNLGQTLIRLERVKDAIARFERAIALAPGRAPFHFNLAQAMGLAGQWDRAIVEYREAARLAPDDHDTRYNLAAALHKKGDVAAAIPEYQRAIALAPDQANFHLSLALSLEQAGRPAEAAREYATYIRLAPTAPDVEKLKEHLKTLTSARAGSVPS
jgi:tetratricopeptide (TPR) repeat protein